MCKFVRSEEIRLFIEGSIDDSVMRSG